jgi:hypothetical protein
MSTAMFTADRVYAIIKFNLVQFHQLPILTICTHCVSSASGIHGAELLS